MMHVWCRAAGDLNKNLDIFRNDRANRSVSRWKVDLGNELRCLRGMFQGEKHPCVVAEFSFVAMKIIYLPAELWNCRHQ
jgi:hypothetical protein